MSKENPFVNFTGKEKNSAYNIAAKNFLLKHNKFLSTGKKGTLYHFDGQVWKSDGEYFVKQECQKLYEPINKWSAHTSREVVESISVASRGSIDIFNKVIFNVVFLNGTYDIEKNKFFKNKFYPEDFCTIQIPHDYNSKDTCTNIDKFMSQIMHPKDVLGFYELFGQCLIKKVLFETTRTISCDDREEFSPEYAKSCTDNFSKSL